jgi:hypothetical protein
VYKFCFHHYYYYYYYYYYYLSPLCRVLKIIFMKQTMFLWDLVLHVFCIYNVWHVFFYMPYLMFCTFTEYVTKYLFSAQYGCFL